MMGGEGNRDDGQHQRQLEREGTIRRGATIGCLEETRQQDRLRSPDKTGMKKGESN